jgi:uncharacterized protein
MRPLISLLLLSLLAAAPSTQPSGALEVRANTAFTNGQYAMALPLLQKLEKQYQGQPDKLGPIAEKIQVCQTQLQQAGLIDPAKPAEPVGPRKPHEKPKDGSSLALTIKDLGNFDYNADKGGNIPADILALSGSTVKITGFMIPIDQAENITQFALVPDLFACCFGQPPQVQHTIVCKAPSGKSVSYYPDELQVEGKLKVEEKKDEGFIVSIFEIDVSSVKPASK